MYTLIERGWKDCSHTIRVTFDSFNHFESLHITFKCQNHLQRSHKNKALLKLQMKLSKFSTLLLKILKMPPHYFMKNIHKTFYDATLKWGKQETTVVHSKMLNLLYISVSWDVIIHTVLCCLPRATRITFFLVKKKIKKIKGVFKLWDPCNLLRKDI